MREILFRGKRVDNGEWVCSGNLIHFNEDNECYIPVVNSKCTCTHDENDNIIEWNEVLFCKVIPETIGQYTGLTDKNGKKIFEGDIVKTDKFNTPNKFYVIKYDLLLGAFIGEDNGTMYFTTFDGDSELFEIIGNIHDNPELLEEEV
jgi:uncharacterized phage protein (TIGR01671 family)